VDLSCCSVKHPVLKHSQSMSVSSYRRPCFTPVRNRQNYATVEFYVCAFKIADVMTKLSEPVTTSVPRIQLFSVFLREISFDLSVSLVCLLVSET
jgi:hypothetical protein